MVSLPASVLSPNIVSRLYKDSGSMTSDRLLDSDIFMVSLSKDYSLVCLASSASHRTALSYTIPVQGMPGKICPWLLMPQFYALSFSPGAVLPSLVDRLPAQQLGASPHTF